MGWLAREKERARDREKGARGVRTREEGRIQSPRRAVVPPSSFLRRRALLTKLFRDRAKSRGEREEEEEKTRGSKASGRIEEREYPEVTLGVPGREPAATRHRPPASSSKRIPACVARIVVAAVDGRSGGRSGAPVEKAEEEEKEDVVLLVVHGQYSRGEEGKAAAKTLA